MLKSITHRPFWVNALFIIAITFLVLFGALKLLAVITKHGAYLTVPKVTNTKTSDAITLLESKGFEVYIQDSVYTDTAKMGTVLKQFPEENSTVKVNRLVLLTVNRVTLPMVEMPALEGKSQGYALEILQRAHLTLGDTTFIPSYMLGAVLSQTYNGKAIAAGTKITWGSKIDLEIGSGLSDEQMIVPSLLGLTYNEAKIVLDQNGIVLASTVVDVGVVDTANAYVYKQNPPRYNEDKSPIFIRSGQVMDVWLSPVMKYISDSSNLIFPDEKPKLKKNKNTESTNN